MQTLHLTRALVGLSLISAAWLGLGKEAPDVWLADDLIGMRVVSDDGESLGKIEDVVVHPGSEASYAVLSFGGWLGMGDKLFAMPWTVLGTIDRDPALDDDEPALLLRLDKARLETAPGFDQDDWPKMANPDWAKEIDAFYVGAVNPDAARPSEAAARKAVMSLRVTELEGTAVETPTGDDLGDIDGLAIDVKGRVSYVVLSVGGFLGVGDRLVAVPWDNLRFTLGGDEGDERLITLASTEEQLEKAPQFKVGEEHRAAMCDPKWIGSIYDYFSCPKYWDTSASTDDDQQVN